MEVCIKDRFWYQKTARAMAKLDKVTAYKNGSTAQFTKASGTKTKLKVKELSGTQKATSTLAILEPIRRMGLVYILMLTAVVTKDNGSMTYKKDKVKKFGSTGLNTLENIQME